ncbi:MAG: hypothetical protein KJ646_02580 [Nanoarchaeota archaeon]|nr:hypothetical protein [Nanoarchaeota archaeon]
MIEWIIQSKESLKLIYAFIIILSCFVIVIKTNKLFKLSEHQGIRYFRNAFFFYGIGFFIRYFFDLKYFIFNKNYHVLTTFIFEYFLIMGGFFLLYSLLWKKIESAGEEYFTSLINSKVLVFYLMAFVIVGLDCIWKTFYFMFFSQIILFAILILISYNNYIAKGSKGKFLKFYLIAMIFSFIAWVLNFLAALTFAWNPGILITIYLLNIIIFLFFAAGVVRITK